MATIEEERHKWFRQRIEAIHNVVTAYDVLRQNGVDLSQISDDRPEQISCPFHGMDKKPSARVYPEDGNSRSHVWCYVCQETGWDAIGLWKKFHNQTFGQALLSIERAYGLETPDGPKDTPEGTRSSESMDRFKKHYLQCERRLISRRDDTYKLLDDMMGYLTAGSVLDKVRYKVDTNQWPPDKGIATLDKLLDKIQSKVNQCPGG